MQATSLGDVLRQRCRERPDKVAMLHPVGKSFEPVTYRQLGERVRSVCGALRDRGLSRGDRLTLQAENGIEWAYLDWACHSLGVILVPVYPTLPPDQSQYIAQDCGAKLCVASTAEQAAKVSDLGLPTVLLGDLMKEADQASFTESEWDSAIDPIRADDLCTIIYTSGTTGNPKGVMLAHRAGMHVCEHAQKEIPWNEDDVFLTFLPMSHVYERVAGQMLPIWLGATIAYAKSVMTLANDLMAVQPTILLCVPRFLEATKDRIEDAIKKAPPLRQKLFAMAYAQGLAKIDGKSAPFAGLLDKLVGEKIRARTGGRIRFFASGGAALPDHVARFYMAFGMTVLQGYGLTETAGGSFVNRPGPRNKYWTVGESLGMECKIASDGEILLRGGGLMMGYYNLPDDTAKAIDEEGWFHTGDIGEFEGSNLKITDRKKDLLVLANGKNVAPQPIESKIKESAFIQEVVLFGDGNEYVYGLIVPNFDRVRDHLGEKADDQALIQLDSVKALIKGEVDRINKNLADFEKVKKHALIGKMFTVDSGELTPSMKVRRKVVLANYDEVLAGLRR